MKLIANILSFLFHPVFMPVIGLLILFNSGIYLSELTRQYQNMILMITALCTILLPLSMIPALIYLRHVQNFSLDERRERLIPLFFTTVCFYVAHHLLQKFLNGVSIFSVFLLASSFVVLILLIVSLYWKISIHSAGIGGILALIAVLSMGFSIDMTFFLGSAVLVAGLLFSARLALESHTVIQLTTGFLSGFAVVFVFLTYYIH